MADMTHWDITCAFLREKAKDRGHDLSRSEVANVRNEIALALGFNTEVFSQMISRTCVVRDFEQEYVKRERDT